LSGDDVIVICLETRERIFSHTLFFVVLLEIDYSSMENLFCAVGSDSTCLSEEDLRLQLRRFLQALGEREDILLIPPDFTRFPSHAGLITQIICEQYKFITPSNESTDSLSQDNNKALQDSVPNIQILPALGTHAPMSESEIRRMFGDALADRKEPSPFLIHDFRNDVVTIGEAPSSMVKDATFGLVDKPWPAQLNRIVWNKRKSLRDRTVQRHHSLVLSIGQVVPHEVMGMANFNKNLFVGTGGVDAINLSHFIGAVHGMERMMGRQNNPLRSILHYASEKFFGDLDLWYILTVVGTDEQTGNIVVRGLYIGRDIQCYSAACELSLKVNFNLLDKPVRRMVAYMDADEFHSTWLSNKSIYRTRMAMADDGELIVLAPGLERFGEDAKADALIRKYGYKGTPAVMKMMEENVELQENLSIVAHLIHGSSEGRFTVTYCPGNLTKEEIESVGFRYGDLKEMTQRYDICSLRDGWNADKDGEFFFIRNPALGLWADKSRFDNSD
jgi:nickel-dependent lactate racemase